MEKEEKCGFSFKYALFAEKKHYLCTQKPEKRMRMTPQTIDNYRLTSMEEPSDEVLAQLMREAAEEASRTNREATMRFFEEIKQAAAAY